MFEQELDKQVKVGSQQIPNLSSILDSLVSYYVCIFLTSVSVINIIGFQEFVVAVIQFRNSFDSQGPGIPGIVPNEAVSRLKDFQGKYHTFEENMKTLHSVQKLYGIMPTPFDELEKTGKVIIVFFQQEILEMMGHNISTLDRNLITLRRDVFSTL